MKALTDRERTQLSKFMSLILRHQPEKFGVELDRHGMTALGELTRAISAQSGWQWITGDHIRHVVKTDSKGRFEILAGDPDQIRATYGHSVPVEPGYPTVEPPQKLYHGTPRRSVGSILAEGLKSMGRQYVHLSSTVGEARKVGERHDPKPVILRIRAREAWEAGLTFYQATEKLYLVDAAPPEFIEVVNADCQDQEWSGQDCRV